MTIELSVLRFVDLLRSDVGRSMIGAGELSAKLGQDFYLYGEKVVVTDRMPHIQWQVDFWRAQRDNQIWEITNG